MGVDNASQPELPGISINVGDHNGAIYHPFCRGRDQRLRRAVAAASRSSSGARGSSVKRVSPERADPQNALDFLGRRMGGQQIVATQRGSSLRCSRRAR